MRWSLVLALVLLAGCGSKGGGDSFEVPPKDGEVYVVRLTSERSFDPARVSVPTDAIVSFRAELAGCSVESREPGGPNSSRDHANGLIPQGGQFNWITPAQDAEFTVFCPLHEEHGMEGRLRVR